ncbi:PAAR domain-containing protein [Pectobacterium brasiliense]|uniref:RHS repeat-associated core domain-containing protein n=1 Tax=Pectobacterium brasiliense TaxID=180957 RepID=UPI00057D180F|nr:RHS repeat-associated core domain-containing protein [Pectobacterium brasiliense]APS30710.1 type IV secretion protein Rhs [Pectobacterium brasiliense]KHT02043.1 type IV secretion protein Rhs [Pectobacterium brasiliense]MBN3099129.1 PAAR domain-containing protein [Pectobacterium brasiliense]MBN3103896.1 PAAR domain-containing protein [Pectobacterium brasiliense]MBN3166171.1 PAAR domain-containing protein [Pectobacterium brasiliense]
MRDDILARIARVGAMHAGNRPTLPPDLPTPGSGSPPTSPGKPIKHSSFLGALLGAVAGALVAAAVAAVAVALVGVTGGLAIAVVGGLAVLGAGSLISAVSGRVSAMVDSASPPAGNVDSGSPNVSVEGNPVSRAEVDVVLCTKHNGPQLIAQGSETVFVNGHPAARIGDKTVCGATIKDGASTVFFGSGQATVLEIQDEFSGWQKALLIAVEFLVPPTRGLFRGLGKLFFRGPKAVMKGLGAGALWAGKRLRQKTRCATRAFKANKGRARVTQAAKAFKKDPVYIASGEVIENRTDIELGQTIPLVFERTYRTASSHAGLVGRGWQDSWSEVATVSQDEGDTHVAITLAQGYDIDFTFGLGTTVVYCAEYPEFKLLRRHNGFHLWHRDSQTWRAFTVKQGDQLLLSAITDNHQNRIDFLRDPKGYLRKIQHSDGIELLLVWQGEFLRQVQRIDGGQKTVLAEYRQDEQGRLVEADASHAYHLFYEYDNHHRLTRWHDNDKTWARYEYDPQGRCIYTTCADGYLTAKFEYLADRVVMTDGLGQRSEYGFNDLHLMAWETSPLGHITRYEYDDAGNLLREISPAGRVVEFAYLDDTGLVSTFTDGSGHQWQYAYDDHERLIGITDPLGRHWSWQYDSKGNPQSLTGPDNSEVRFAWNRYGLLTEVSDHNGQVQASLFYDHRQRLLSATDAESRTQQLRYDQQDRLTTWTRPDGSTYRLGYRRASWKLPEQLLRPDDKQEQRQYDKHNNLLNYTDGNGAVWRQTYGAFDLLTSRTDAAGRTWQYEYDKESQQLVCVTAPDGNRWQWWLDADARVIRERDMAGTETRYSYDEDGHCISIRNGEGETRHFLYDGRGLLIKENAPDDILHYRYDAAGRLIEVTSATSHIQLEYDARDRVVREWNSGTAIRRHYQDASHTLTRSLHWDGEEDSAALTSTFRYSATGELRQVQLPDGAELTLVHDGAGRESSRQSHAGFMQHREYDAMGWLTREMSGQTVDGRLQPVQTREYLYDGAGNLTGTRRNREAAGYQLDASGRVLSVLSGGAGRTVNTEEQYRYTRNGLPQDTTRLTEWQAGRLTQQDNTHYQYDKAGRLIRKQVVQPGYRPQVWHYRWDSRNQLRVVDTPTGERWSYRYDPFGRRIGKRCEQTQDELRYLWDGDQIAEVRHHRENQLISRRHWVHNGWELLVQQRQNTDGSWETDFVTSGHNGEPQAIFNQQGELRWQAPRTNLWGQRYTDNTENLDPELAFAGQYRDAESGLCYNRFRYYEPSGGGYISPDPIGIAGGENNYGYVQNPTCWVDPFGLASCRLTYMGRTPGKKTKTGRAVIERMRGEGRIRGSGDRMQFKSSTDSKWYRIQDADMAHLTDAVKYWNQKGGYYGAKSKEVRAFMRDPKNYELEYFGHNRSQGASLPDRYRNPSDFIGPAEISQYFL